MKARKNRAQLIPKHIMPMNNTSTTVNKKSVSEKQSKAENPARLTLDFIRQFARVYQSSRVTIIGNISGVVLN